MDDAKQSPGTSINGDSRWRRSGEQNLCEQQNEGEDDSLTVLNNYL